MSSMSTAGAVSPSRAPGGSSASTKRSTRGGVTTGAGAVGASAGAGCASDTEGAISATARHPVVATKQASAWERWVSTRAG